MNKYVKISLITAFAFGALIVSTLAFIGIFGPDSKAVPAGKIKPWHNNTIRKICNLAPDEKILMFYSAGLISVASEGNLLTDKGVYSYEKDEDGKLDVQSGTFAQFLKVDVEWSSSLLEDSTITVFLTNEEAVVIIAPTEGKSDKLFYNKLMEQWNKWKSTNQPPTPQSSEAPEKKKKPGEK